MPTIAGTGWGNPGNPAMIPSAKVGNLRKLPYAPPKQLYLQRSLQHFRYDDEFHGLTGLDQDVN